MIMRQPDVQYLANPMASLRRECSLLKGGICKMKYENRNNLARRTNIRADLDFNGVLHFRRAKVSAFLSCTAGIAAGMESDSKDSI